MCAVIPSSCVKHRRLGTSLQTSCWRSPCTGGTGGDGVATAFQRPSPPLRAALAGSCFPYICVRRTAIAQGNGDLTTATRLIQRNAPLATIPLCQHRAAGGCSQPTRSLFYLPVCFCGQVSCSPRSLGTLFPGAGIIWRCFVLPPSPVGVVL